MPPGRLPKCCFGFTFVLPAILTLTSYATVSRSFLRTYGIPTHFYALDLGP
jgi:hypothetical protein